MSDIKLISTVLTKYARELDPMISKIIVDEWEYTPAYKNPPGVYVGHPDFRVPTGKSFLDSKGTVYLKRIENYKKPSILNSDTVKQLYGSEIFNTLSKIFFENPYYKHIGIGIDKNTNTGSKGDVDYNFVIE
jgi:hypothetical protein